MKIIDYCLLQKIAIQRPSVRLIFQVTNVQSSDHEFGTETKEPTIRSKHRQHFPCDSNS